MIPVQTIINGVLISLGSSLDVDSKIIPPFSPVLSILSFFLLKDKSD